MTPESFHVKQPAGQRPLPVVPLVDPPAGAAFELLSLMAELGIAVTQEQAEQLAVHLQFVIEANKVAQLTSVTEFADGLIQHVVDSALALPEVQRALAGPIADLGSGGGFPGVPLAVLSDRDTLLVDSVSKKARLMEQYARSAHRTGGRISAFPGRAESLARTDQRGSFAIVTARAVSQLPALVELAAPLLSDGGDLIALKGDLSNDEKDRGDQVAALLGMRSVSFREYQLPRTGAKRTVVVYRRHGPLKVDLPRNEGQAQHNPLA